MKLHFFSSTDGMDLNKEPQFKTTKAGNFLAMADERATLSTQRSQRKAGRSGYELALYGFLGVLCGLCERRL
jgi:hypothetical protein